MPPYYLINKDYLRGLLREDKNAFKLSEIKPVNVPHYHEINVAAILDKYKSDLHFKSYLPDITAKGKQQDRTFLFTVFNTLHPDIMQEIIKNSM